MTNPATTTRVAAELLQQDRIAMVQRALAEDLNGLNSSHDLTAQLIPPQQQVSATLITREAMVVCGTAWVDEVFVQLGSAVQRQWLVSDAQQVSANTQLLRLHGCARDILTAERSALNFLQTLSAVATTTAHYVAQLQGSSTQLLDTRKTIPGLRTALKYAVTCGGGYNHRVGLYDAYLIKENHIIACGGIAAAVSQARQLNGAVTVEVEVETMDEYQLALDAGADIIMLDNFSITAIKQAVALRRGHAKLEVSGNITAERLAELAATGVDYISSGALTKNIQAIDLSLRIEPR
jgi:nicotinate-nucleotide pyrophosphorylase (carboxylating)